MWYTCQGTDPISYVEAEDVAAAVTIPTVDIVSHRLEVLTAPISTLNTPIKCTRRRVFMQLPILTEARILGVKRPIAKGIADFFNTNTGLVAWRSVKRSVQIPLAILRKFPRTRSAVSVGYPSSNVYTCIRYRAQVFKRFALKTL